MQNSKSKFKKRIHLTKRIEIKVLDKNYFWYSEGQTLNMKKKIKYQI